MRTIKITQIKSAIDRPERQKLTLRALGLNKMNASRAVVGTPQILGMIRAVDHLLRVEAVEGGAADTIELAFEERVVAMQEPAMVQPEAVTDYATQAVISEETPITASLQNTSGFAQESPTDELPAAAVNDLDSGSTAMVSDEEEVVFKQEGIHPLIGDSAEDEAKAIN